MFVADAHRGDGKRFVVRSDEILTAFTELQLAGHKMNKVDFPLRADKKAR